MAGFYSTISYLYDSEHADKTEDLSLYSELAADSGDPILIIGSGTGRVALFLADEGYTVHGVEIDAQMLEKAQQKLEGSPHLAGRVTFHQGDALKVQLDTQYKLVVIPYNTFMHFHSQEAHLGLLKRIQGWLAPGGMLVIDLPNAGEAFAGADSEALTLERTFTDEETGNLIMQQSVSRLDRVEQLMYVTWIYDEISSDNLLYRTVAPTIVRYFFLSEMRLLLTAAGLTLDEVYGDFDSSPFVDGAPRMIVVARNE
ncbi:MAG: class I SAM-dependent methyltransferase [Anaerolineae bacterium]|jgi:SAM-dependent methyltransferase|uniref:class I SAM-dependent methyltransferase n=1 Tax=Candidatus Flexifilum breve TaxID=3140694 RepID=UPI001AC19F68|nr:class I SAM-dependent methyltransferase [Chloroflexota bacterium]MBK9750225.1 class I SAM-dependent methyltransferase [Chloroflexota bacterium]MBN8639360.1 class I SAM-dependent methyltransferase [Anaerolineae bacterium]